jgi:DNA-binding NarL/FixJ family response regulator
MKVELRLSQRLDLSPCDWQDSEAIEATLRCVNLTPRQREVLAYLLRGYSNKLIARALDLSVETVKDHVGALLRALKVSSRTQVIVAVSRISLTASHGRPADSALRPHDVHNHVTT